MDKEKKSVKIKSKVNEESTLKKKINDDDDEYYNKDIQISSFYYINKNKTTLSDLKNGRRIFQNKTDLSAYNENDIEFNKNFIEFRQLLFENLLLKEDLTDNSKNEKKTIESALFSSFCYENEFLEPMINTFKLPSIIILHDENNHKYNRMEEEGNYIKYIFPKIDYTLKWGKFHSKLIILKFPNFIRIIIPSANLTNCDWYYWGQIIWFQDFPKLNEENDIKDKKVNDDFLNYLNSFMDTFMINTYKGKKFWTDLNINLDDYDYSECCIDLLASANGRFYNKEKNLFGIGRLKYLIYDKYKIEKNSNLIIQCSSIGNSKNKKFYSNLYNAFNLCDNYSIDIYYPTIEYIKSFPMGEKLTGCLFLSEDAYQFHREKFRIIELKEKYNDRKTVFHSKIFITGDKKKGYFDINDNSIIYFGSHNFSAAAFGNFEKNDKQISIANYELGIIFNPNKISLYEKKEIFNSLIINFSSRYYNKSDEPYIFDFTQEN